MITQRQGVYRESPLFERDRNLYVKHGGGFVMLYAANQTGLLNMRWVHLDAPGRMYATGELGRLVWANESKLRSVK